MLDRVIRHPSRTRFAEPGQQFSALPEQLVAALFERISLQTATAAESDLDLVVDFDWVPPGDISGVTDRLGVECP